VVALAVDMLDACGLVDWELRIGHVGITNDILTTLGLSDQSLGGTGEGTEGGESPVASAMRYLDKGDWDGLQELFAKHGISSAGIGSLQALSGLSGGVETLSKAREILTELGVESDSLDELEQLCSALNHLAPSPPKLSVNLCVARGLDYYTGMVFEAHVEELGGEGQVLGGGTYRLLHLFDLGDLDPCCGFGLGFDRVLLALQAQAERLGRAEVVAGENSGRPALAVIPLNIEPENYLSLVADLRASGLVVELELRSRGVGKSLAWAENMGATHAIIIGQRDLDSGQITIKDLSTGEQTTTENNPQAILDNIL
jgi:histidyl-tRNA synthetase